MSNEASRRTILLVEDQAVIAMDEAKRIEGFGYNVITAHSGEEAVDLCRQNASIHLVLMDIDLGPGMDGTEAATRILENQEIPIVFLTSHAEKEYVDRVKQITRYGYVLKNSGNFVLQSSIEMAFELFDAFTRLKKQQQEIKKNEAFLTKIFEILPIGLWIADENGTLQKGNPAGVQIWGDEPRVGQDEYGVFSARRLPSGEEIQPYDWALAHSINEGITVKDELLEIDTFDGKKKIILNYTAPVIDDNNNLQGAIIVNQDITDRKLAEDTLLEKEEKYRNLFENAPLGMFRSTLEGRFIEVNQALAHMLGYESPQQVLREIHNIAEQIYIRSEERAHIIEEQLQTGNTQHYINHYRRRNGSEFTANLYLTTIHDENGEPKYLEGIVEDITESRKIEDQVESLAIFQSSLIDVIPAPVFYKDKDGKYLGINRAFTDFFGIKENDIIGKTARDIAPPHLAEIYEKKDRELYHGSNTQVYEAQVMDTDETPHDVIFYKALFSTKNDDKAGIIGVILDITRLRLGEENLKKTSELLLGILRHSPLLINIHDLDGRYLQVSKSTCDLMRMEPSRIENKSFSELFPEEVTATFKERINLVKKTRESLRVEDTLILHNEKRVFDTILFPLIDDQQNMIYIGSIAHDITDRRKAIIDLEESEQKYRRIFNNAPLGLLRFDNDGVITECNDIFVTIIGSSREKLIGLNMLQLPDTRVTGSIRQMFEEKKTTSIEIMYSSVTADKVTPIRIICAPVILDNGEPNGGVMIVEDITERKRTENELRQSEERYRRILSEIEDGYYEVDLAGRFVSFNDSMCRMLGYGSGELTGIHYREYADEENSRKIFEAFNSVYRSGKPTRESSWVLFTTAGEKKYIEASVSLIKNEAGKPTGFRGIARDITAHKEDEMAIHDLFQEKSDLLNELQHRVKNSMQLMSSLVNIELGNTENADTRNSLETIHGQIQSLSSLYTLLYDTGSIHTVKLDVYFSSIVNSLKSTYITQDNRVTFNEQYARIAFDAKKATSLGLIVNELVTNALKHAFPDELHGTIYVELREENESITLTVSDDGVALPVNFDVEDSGGTGMKLVSMLARQLNGTFTVVQNKTTRFVISIPLV
ncbi:MAG: PAS domain S-box protein [Spirochaetota bacterium]